MTIVINGRFLTQPLTGVQRFADGVVSGLIELHQDLLIVAPPGDLREGLPKNWPIHQIGKLQGHLWEQFCLPRGLRSLGSPLLLNLCNSGPCMYRHQIVTMHDISMWRFPESYSKKYRIWYSMITPVLLRRSHHVLTVSEFSKTEILREFRIQDQKISVIHNAVNAAPRMQSISESVGGQGSVCSYVLLVGSRAAHKNQELFISAFKKYKSMTGDDVRLKIVGGQARAFAHRDRTYHPDIDYLGRVSDTELSELYRCATAFAFPSLYEGFGIPPLEAQAAGCPVLCSSAASLTEVLGESALYFDPKSSDSIVHALERMLNCPDLRRSLVRAGTRNLTRFSWRKSAQGIVDIVERIEERHND